MYKFDLFNIIKTYNNCLKEKDDILNTISNNEVDKNNYYEFVPSPVEIFEVLFPQLKKTTNFLDIGCGLGCILKTIETELPKVNCYGIEHNKNLKPYLEGLNISFIDAIQTKYDYSKYDTIYMYRPIKSQEKSKKLLSNILKTAKNCKIIYLLPHNIELDLNIKYSYLSNNIKYCIIEI